MPESLERFAVSADGYTFPVDEVLTGRGFITGKSGSGKSNTASVFIEELLDRDLGLLIVDTDGEYHGLKEEFDVLHAGKGDDCDLTVTVDDADRLARMALEDRVPILLDIATIGDEEEVEAILFEVINALFVKEQEYRMPFAVFLEEAHEFIPQQGGRGGSDLKKLIVRVAKRGRKRGLGICCMSQRPAAVDKDYITQCDWFVWHRLTWETDTAVVDRILGGDSAETVQSLGDGEAIVLTDWDESVTRVQFRRKRTADAGATPTIDNLDLQPGSSTNGSSGSSTGTQTQSDSPAGELSNSSTISQSDELTPASADSSTESGGETQSIVFDSSGSTATDSGGSNSVESSLAGATSSTAHGAENTSVRYGSVERSDEPFGTTKPSLARRRERRDVPRESGDPLWELGMLIVYLYDTVVWYHLYLVNRLEWKILRGVDRVDTFLGGPNGRRGVSQYERYVYRLLAVILAVGLYVGVALVISTRL